MPPVVIAAGVAGAAGIGAAALGGSAQSKAAKSAANTAQNTANANNALSRENREFSAARLDPYAQRGNDAGNAINALLGLGVSTQPQAAYGAPPAAGGPSYGDISAMWTDGIPGNARAAQNAMQARQAAAPPAPVYASPATAEGGVTPYQNAFQNYLGSTGYQFQVDQGNQAINQGYAAKGSLQSGAALKALQTYGQNTATGFFKDYLGLLGNQQGVGLNGARAVAGVGGDYVNSVSSNNNAAGSAAANSALAQGNATAGLYGSIAGAVGGVANAFGSSYGSPSLPPPRYGYSTPGYVG